ncbi:hypothetical protein BV22DRAFT_1028145 [Leucogyrophana mollusca]|uniref:Uncharacterized protein n=1 Tax=Leucogyrophana mollusca TaxID=85980 RepID=A0ACB8C1F2_9AGAM|nr:hypothetical protein BV22DRAFT_1028145 [Leucogyrophana mollusca]
MDDDFNFNASVWGAPSDPTRLATITTAFPTLSSPGPSTSQTQFDDFDDFHTPPQTDHDPSVAQDDDFGDFGDFGEAEEMGSAGGFGEGVGGDFGQELGGDFGQEFEGGFSEEEVTPVAGPSQTTWEPFRPSPATPREELERQIDEILGPVWSDDLSALTTDEDIRQVEGISQVLVTSESRHLYNLLVKPPSLLEPINWTRSRIRQQHLISLGIPVNLDEIMPHASGKPLPPLQISTRPMSAPPGARNGPLRGTPAVSRSNSRAGTPRSGTPQPTRSGPTSVSQLGLGPKPVLDDQRVNELLELDADQLPLLPLAKLERYLADLRTQTTNTSSLLTHLLQTRDALQQDSETYNKLIAELVSEAQKSKTGKGRTAGKRGTMG